MFSRDEEVNFQRWFKQRPATETVHNDPFASLDSLIEANAKLAEAMLACTPGNALRETYNVVVDLAAARNVKVPRR